MTSRTSHPITTGLLATAIGVGLTLMFWTPLWEGGGFIGGDLYPYFLPQKQFYAESLRAGEIPYWNDRVAHGYPQLAESQTGVFYPTHPPLYRWFDVNTAYAIDHVLHYVLAFCGMFVLARTLGLSVNAALLAGLVYTYGWFPARASLEWAILGGAWTPWALWTLERWLVTRRWRFGFGLSAIVAMQLLAGHFNLCFITLLLLAAFAPARLWWFPARGRKPAPEAVVLPPRRGRLLALTGCALLLGFLLAAIQLLPAWELKRESQRSNVDGKYSIAYGNLPPQYLSQLVLQLKWTVDGTQRDSLLESMAWGNFGAGTNFAEAHLYFGILPLLLIVAGLFVSHKDSLWSRGELWFWWILALLALTYAFGWWLPLTRHLPGFSFFQGPGRFTLMSALAGALLAGEAAERMRHRVTRSASPVFWGFVFLATAADLWAVAGSATYATQLREPPIEYSDQSVVADVLRKEGNLDELRVFGPGPNVPTLLGVSALPQYLGIGPKEYFDPELTIPDAAEQFAADGTVPLDAARREGMIRAGATHVLSFDPLEAAWDVELLSKHPDPFLNGVWGRGYEPIYLYRLNGARGRTYWIDAADDASVTLSLRTPTRQEWAVRTTRENTFVVTELLFPGWRVEIDGTPAEALRIEGRFRGVAVAAGEHRVAWIYAPASLYWGRWISLATLLALAALAHVRFWHPARLRWLDAEPTSSSN